MSTATIARQGLLKLAFCAVLAVIGQSHRAADSAEPIPPNQRGVMSKKVLALGLDGCRPDALKIADTPNLDELIKSGAYAENTLILGPRYQKNDTVSGPGWTSILTGVWADKHGVQDNQFSQSHFEAYPHFFTRVKEKRPEARTASFVTWKPIHERILRNADTAESFADKDYAAADAASTSKASEFLSGGDPDVMFVYFGAIDETGHRHGFHPTVKEYVAAIEQVDAQVGKLLAALRARRTYDSEDWLILATADHGGRGTGHGGGHQQAEILQVFFLVSGHSAKVGKIEQQTYLVDYVPTVLTHLGIAVDPKWHLDGRAVGLRGKEISIP